MKLSIVIPAFNEESAIADVIERTLAARASIRERCAVKDVEIIVVSDGSTDRTTAICASYEEVKLVAFEENRGYGVAIKEGFAQSTGDILAFLDADGTCDPEFLGPLCTALLDEDADIAVGSRMGRDSKMPRVRRFGNTIYAGLLSALGNRTVRDAASGMRALRRSSLPKIYPLPDGLDFALAMSARAILDGELKIVEVPIRYGERVGRSKLRVLRDGLSFLQTMTELALTYRPLRVFGILAAICFAFAFLLGLYPLEHYLHHRGLLEWMIYRLLLSSLVASFGVGLLVAGVICERLLDLPAEKRRARSLKGGVLQRLLSGRRACTAAGALFVLAIAIVWPGLRQFFATGRVLMHWSRAVVGAFMVLAAFQVVVAATVLHVIDLVAEAYAHHRGSGNGGPGAISGRSKGGDGEGQ